MVLSRALAVLLVCCLAGAELGSFDIPCPLAPRLCLGAAPGSSALLTAPAPTGDDADRIGAADLPFNDTMAYVHKILQETIEVEHSTIPLYLTSLFSIVNSSNFAGATLHSVVIEEMLHMTTACNMLNAMGGAPAIDSPVFIPVYPLRLPMINVTADIRRFDAASVANFMLIESTTALSKSIAACYEYVLSIVQKLSEEYGEPAVFTGNYSYQVQASAMGPTGLQTAGKIGNLSEARVALLGVSDQGGGCPVPGEEQLWPGVSNISAGPLGGNLSHYARFAQVAAGRAYGPADHVAGPGFPPTGRNVTTDWTHVYAFAPNPRVADFANHSAAHGAALSFAANYTALLAQLHDVFNGAPQNYFKTLAGMHALTGMARDLMTTDDPRKPPAAAVGIGPTWEYVPSASRFAARGMKARPIV